MSDFNDWLTQNKTISKLRIYTYIMIKVVRQQISLLGCCLGSM